MNKTIIAALAFGFFATACQAMDKDATDQIKKVTLYKPTPSEMLSATKKVSRASINKALERAISNAEFQPAIKEMFNRYHVTVQNKESNPDTVTEILAIPYSLRNVGMNKKKADLHLPGIFNHLSYLLSFALYDATNEVIWENSVDGILNAWNEEVKKTLK